MPLTLDPVTMTFKGRSFHITEEKNALLAPYHKQIWNYGVRLMLVPSQEQASMISQQIGNARFLRNQYLDARIQYYNEHKETLTRETFVREYLPKIREGNPWLEKSDSIALQSALEHVDDAYNHFFQNLKKGKKGKSAGFPKFADKNKPNGNRYTTKYSKNSTVLSQDGAVFLLRLPKIGTVPFVCPNGSTLNSLCPAGTRVTSASVQTIENR